MFENVITNTSKIIIGNTDRIKLALAAIISEGSILIEDYPGSGKTTFAKALTLNLGLNFKRIQFTSDLLPSDILGFNVLSNDKINFQQGPIFTNIVLADELNRGSPKSQSAFLEAMEEKKVSIDGESHSLPEPFFDKSLFRESRAGKGFFLFHSDLTLVDFSPGSERLKLFVSFGTASLIQDAAISS